MLSAAHLGPLGQWQVAFIAIGIPVFSFKENPTKTRYSPLTGINERKPLAYKPPSLNAGCEIMVCISPFSSLDSALKQEVLYIVSEVWIVDLAC